jgi:hypothetical protein
MTEYRMEFLVGSAFGQFSTTAESWPAAAAGVRDFIRVASNSTALAGQNSASRKSTTPFARQPSAL